MKDRLLYLIVIALIGGLVATGFGTAGALNESRRRSDAVDAVLTSAPTPVTLQVPAPVDGDTEEKYCYRFGEANGFNAEYTLLRGCRIQLPNGQWTGLISLLN